MLPFPPKEIVLLVDMHSSMCSITLRVQFHNMERGVMVVGGAVKCPLSALLYTAKRHQTQQLTSLRHKTWQQLNRPNLWSDNPICEILSLFLSVRVGGVDIFGAKLILCSFCDAVLNPSPVSQSVVNRLLSHLWPRITADKGFTFSLEFNVSAACLICMEKAAILQ